MINNKILCLDEIIAEYATDPNVTLHIPIYV